MSIIASRRISPHELSHPPVLMEGDALLVDARDQIDAAHFRAMRAGVSVTWIGDIPLGKQIQPVWAIGFVNAAHVIDHSSVLNNVWGNPGMESSALVAVSGPAPPGVMTGDSLYLHHEKFGEWMPQ